MKKTLQAILPVFLVGGLLMFMYNFKYSETLTEEELQAIQTEISKVEDDQYVKVTKVEEEEEDNQSSEEENES